MCRPGRFRGTKLPSFPRAESGNRKRKSPVCCVRSGGAADDAYWTGRGTGPRRGQSVAGLCPGWPNPKCGTPHSLIPKQPDTGLTLNACRNQRSHHWHEREGTSLGQRQELNLSPNPDPPVLLLPHRVAGCTVSKGELEETGAGASSRPPSVGPVPVRSARSTQSSTF